MLRREHPTFDMSLSRISFLVTRHHKTTVEDLRRYQLHLVKSGMATGSINARLSGLRFFFEVTLDDANRLKRIKRVNQPRKLPEILSVERRSPNKAALQPVTLVHSAGIARS